MIVQRAALDRCTAAFGREPPVAQFERQSLLLIPLRSLVLRLVARQNGWIGVPR